MPKRQQLSCSITFVQDLSELQCSLNCQDGDALAHLAGQHANCRREELGSKNSQYNVACDDACTQTTGQASSAYLMCIMGWGFLLVWVLDPQLGHAAMGTPCSLLVMLRPTGMSREGLASKNPNGFRKKPTCSAGMTGQSSILGMCVTPKECQMTQSASTRFLSCTRNTTSQHDAVACHRDST